MDTPGHSRRRFLVTTAAVLGSAFVAPSATAWGLLGHSLVGAIGDLESSENTRKWVRELLDGKSLGDSDIANWADVIKLDETNTKSWHTVAIPLGAKRSDGKRIESYAHHGNCVTVKLREMLAIVQDDGRAKDERARALKFVVHFMGDLHQPLHCAERLTTAGKYDHFGMDVYVRWPGRNTARPLHRAWDRDVVEFVVDSVSGHGASAEACAKALVAQATAEDRKAAAAGSIDDWAWESHELARTIAYPGIPITDRIVQLDREYKKRAMATVKSQLLRAGLRLGYALNALG